MVYTAPTGTDTRLSEATRVERLEPPEAPVDIVLDTDTYNEIDDQFAFVYAFLSERIDVQAVYAAPFDNENSAGPADGVDKSYAEIERLRSLLGGSHVETPAFRGATGYMAATDGPVTNAATDDLVARARDRDAGDPLYVVSIGAPTNVASAIERAPEIVESVVVVWLGGHPLTWHTAWEFNLFQDRRASRVLFDSGVPLVLVPCKNVAEQVRTTVPELEARLPEDDELATFLLDTVRGFQDDREAHHAWSKEVWDVAAVATILDREWVPTHLVHSPHLSEEFRYSRDTSRHLIRVGVDARRDPILTDFFEKIADR